MDIKQREDVRVLRRLFWLCGLAVAWELLVRPLLGLCCPELDLPPSFMKEVLGILCRLCELAF